MGSRVLNISNLKRNIHIPSTSRVVKQVEKPNVLEHFLDGLFTRRGPTDMPKAHDSFICILTLNVPIIYKYYIPTVTGQRID